MSRFRNICICILIILLSGTSSCALPSSTALPESTQTSPPLSIPTSTESPTIQPTFTPLPSPSDTPAVTPMTSDFRLPNGIATVGSSGGMVAYYNLQGQLLGEMQSPNLGTGGFQQAQIAGPLTTSPSLLLPSLVYYAFENGGELWLNDNNNLSLLRAAPNLYSLIGVPGMPILAYTLVESTDVGVRSKVYLSALQALPTADTVLDNTNSQSFAIKPLAIVMNNDQPSGLWYTTVPYGIGGDIVFDPRSGLNYLDLSEYTINAFLDMKKTPVGISDDQTWVAYTPSGGNGAMSILHNFDNSTLLTFPMREDTDRGSGDAVFSPDNHYLAWREAGGRLADQPSSFHETIRIGTLDGIVITDIPDSALISVSGFSEIGWVVPIGWLDPQTLALAVRSNSWESACLISVKFDGSGLTYLAPGAFIGFLYP